MERLTYENILKLSPDGKFHVLLVGDREKCNLGKVMSFICNECKAGGLTSDECYLGKAIRRLYEYEKSGLSPDDVQKLVGFMASPF